MRLIKLIIYILGGILITGSIYGYFVYPSSKSQLALTDTSNDYLECPTCEECPICEECPKCELQIITKEIIKEVPIEKIVEKIVEKPIYIESECPIIPTVINSKITYSQKDKFYIFKSEGEGFQLKEIIFCQDQDIRNSEIYYSINGMEYKHLANSSYCYLYNINYSLPLCDICLKSNLYPAYVSLSNFVFPKDSELTIYNKTRDYFQIILIRFQGMETEKIISLP